MGDDGMRKLFALMLIGILFAGCAENAGAAAQSPAGGASGGTTAEQSANAAVSIKGFAFNPAQVTVNMGMSVKWTNEDSVPHAIRFEDGTESPVLQSGQSYTRTFGSAGDYPYSCSIHPFMKGSVKVVGQAGS
jgi:plastocyanin